MIDVLIFLGITLIVSGFLWGLWLAFKRSTLTGIVALLTAPAGVILFLLLVRPDDFKRPTALIGSGIVLAILAGLLQ